MASRRTTAEELIETLEQIVDRAHAHGIKVMGGTLMPMGGLWLHNPETEAMRQTTPCPRLPQEVPPQRPVAA